MSGLTERRVLVQFEVARASCPCEFMAKMAMPLQTEPVPKDGTGKSKFENRESAAEFRVSIFSFTS
jgi:hypothetical protein